MLTSVCRTGVGSRVNIREVVRRHIARVEICQIVEDLNYVVLVGICLDIAAAVAAFAMRI